MKRDNRKASRQLIGKTLFALVFFLGLLNLQACYEPVSDCLDIYASDFNANADKACEDDCCTYPSLNLTINHKVGEQNLSYDSIFYDIGSGDSVRFVKIVFYLSEIEVVNDDSSFQIREKVAVQRTTGETLLLTDDFALVNLSNGRSYKLGTYRSIGVYDRVLFRLGLRETINEVNPLSLADNHDLSIQADSMWREADAYALAQVSLVTQANNSDTLTYFVPNLNNSILMGGFSALDIGFGENSNITLNVDYLKWLEGIDFVANGDNPDLVVTEIIKGLPESISVSQ